MARRARPGPGRWVGLRVGAPGLAAGMAGQAGPGSAGPGRGQPGFSGGGGDAASSCEEDGVGSSGREAGGGLRRCVKPGLARHLAGSSALAPGHVLQAAASTAWILPYWRLWRRWGARAGRLWEPSQEQGGGGCF